MPLELQARSFDQILLGVAGGGAHDVDAADEEGEIAGQQQQHDQAQQDQHGVQPLLHLHLAAGPALLRLQTALLLPELVPLAGPLFGLLLLPPDLGLVKQQSGGGLFGVLALAVALLRPLLAGHLARPAAVAVEGEGLLVGSRRPGGPVVRCFGGFLVRGQGHGPGRLIRSRPFRLVRGLILGLVLRFLVLVLQFLGGFVRFRQGFLVLVVV